MTDKGPANLSCRIHARRVGFGSTIEILWRERQIGRCRHGASFALYVVGVCLNRIGTNQTSTGETQDYFSRRAKESRRLSCLGGIPLSIASVAGRVKLIQYKNSANIRIEK